MTLKGGTSPLPWQPQHSPFTWCPSPPFSARKTCLFQWIVSSFTSTSRAGSNFQQDSTFLQWLRLLQIRSRYNHRICWQKLRRWLPWFSSCIGNSYPLPTHELLFRVVIHIDYSKWTGFYPCDFNCVHTGFEGVVCGTLIMITSRNYPCGPS